jgi:hypothetical protein
MSATARFHRHRAGRQLCGKSNHAIAAHTPPHDNRPIRVEADDATAVLAQIDAKDHNAHGPFLPLLNTGILHRRRREGRPSIKGDSGGRGAWPIARRLHHQTSYARCDAKGRPLGFVLTPGQTHDIQGFAPLFRVIADRIEAFLADKGYDADAIREEISSANIEAVIPSKSNRRDLIPHDKVKYK